MFFRASVVERARELGLVGWVRNRHDGSVECVAEGDGECLLALRAYCESGPPGAQVKRVETIDEPETGGFTSFVQRASG
ncbi:MAG TPA: acylphosphatase [Candidatus Eremiobacteraceae bacterium]